MALLHLPNGDVRELHLLKVIFTDFDGVWTDGKVIVNQEGQESVVCSRKDTLRIKELKEIGIEIFVISKEQNPVVAKRCEKMKVEFKQGVDGKLQLLKQLLEEKGFSQDQAMYVGDDINDLDCLKFVGMPVTVADGDRRCKEIAHVLSRRGGDHAMRELFDLILEAHGK